MRVVVSEIESLRTRRIQQWIRLLLLCVLAGTLPATTDARAASFTATLEPGTVAVGDTAALKLVFEGSGQIQLSPLPRIPGLVISGPEQGSSTRIVNGQRTDSINVTYYLRPTQTDVFTVPPLTARIAGEEFRSPSLQLKAVNATQSAGTQALAMLRLVVPRERVYIGETLVIELQLLLNPTVSNVSDFDIPNFSGEGWLAGEAVRGQNRRVQFGNQQMTVVPVQDPGHATGDRHSLAGAPGQQRGRPDSRATAGQRSFRRIRILPAHPITPGPAGAAGAHHRNPSIARPGCAGRLHRRDRPV